MLVLTRRETEAIVIADTIRVTVVRVKDGVVRLGIEADKEVPVHRLEVWERLQGERKAG